MGIWGILDPFLPVDHIVRGLHNTDSTGPGKIFLLFYRVCELSGLHNIGYEGYGAFMINTYSKIALHNIYDRLVKGSQAYNRLTTTSYMRGLHNTELGRESEGDPPGKNGFFVATLLRMTRKEGDYHIWFT